MPSPKQTSPAATNLLPLLLRWGSTMWVWQGGLEHGRCTQERPFDARDASCARDLEG